jgi:hypothetical protein
MASETPEALKSGVMSERERILAENYAAMTGGGERAGLLRGKWSF